MRYWLIGLTFTLLGSSSKAQTLRSFDVDRGLHPAPNVPGDGMPFTQRYNYASPSFITFGGMSGRELAMQDYFDRVARAYKHGYKVPHDPYPPAPIDFGPVEETIVVIPDAAPTTAPAAKVGIFGGLFRRR